MTPAEQKPEEIRSAKPVDWLKVKRILVVKLRSIGDAVLSTPSLVALKRFLPDAEIDILLENWVAPLLDGFEGVHVITVGKSAGSRLRTAWSLRRRGYDLAVNLHGGSTASLLIAASGARHRVGYQEYRYPFIYNHLLSSSSDFWQQEKTHSAEQQLALLGFIGVPVDDRPRTELAVTAGALASLDNRFFDENILSEPFALFHGSTTFATKRWSPENFARTAEFLAEKGIRVVAVAGPGEEASLIELKNASRVTVISFAGLSLQEITALASRARLFVGIDSGVAHIAAAVKTPSVVIFGYSNRDHWRPWTDAPHEIVFEEFACQPCAGYRCYVYDEPRCILTLKPEKVFAAIERVLAG